MSQPPSIGKDDADAIAAALTQAWASKRIETKALISDGCLQIVTIAEPALEEVSTVLFIRRLLLSMGYVSIGKITILGYAVGKNLPTWNHEIELSGTNTTQSAKTSEKSSIPSQATLPLNVQVGMPLETISYPQRTSSTGTAFIVSGSTAGASLSVAVGKMGLVGGFGGVGIGMVPTALAGGVVGSAAYGALRALERRDSAALGAIGLGAAGGIGVYSAIGGMGLSFGGTAVGIGMGSMAVTGGIVGLGLYGLAALIDDSATYKETPAQVFDRMEEKILGMETYASALMELEAEISGEALKQKIFALEIEDELQALKAKVSKEKMVKAMEDQKELRAFKALVGKKLPPVPVFFQ